MQRKRWEGNLQEKKTSLKKEDEGSSGQRLRVGNPDRKGNSRGNSVETKKKTRLKKTRGARE